MPVWVRFRGLEKPLLFGPLDLKRKSQIKEC